MSRICQVVSSYRKPDGVACPLLNSSTLYSPHFSEEPQVDGKQVCTSNDELREEQLVIRGKKVLWCSFPSGVVHKSFSFPCEVVQAVWCRFRDPPLRSRDSASAPAPDPAKPKGSVARDRRSAGVEALGAVVPALSASESSSAERYLCVLVTHEQLTIYAESGEVFEAALPFRCSAIWPLDHGLLLQRGQDTPSTADADPGDTGTAAAAERNEAEAAGTAGEGGKGVGGGERGVMQKAEEEGGGEEHLGIPSLFSLKHPLEDVRPVSVSRADAAKVSSHGRQTPAKRLCRGAEGQSGPRVESRLKDRLQEQQQEEGEDEDEEEEEEEEEEYEEVFMADPTLEVIFSDERTSLLVAARRSRAPTAPSWVSVWHLQHKSSLVTRAAASSAASQFFDLISPRKNDAVKLDLFSDSSLSALSSPGPPSALASALLLPTTDVADAESFSSFSLTSSSSAAAETSVSAGAAAGVTKLGGAAQDKGWPEAHTDEEPAHPIMSEMHLSLLWHGAVDLPWGGERTSSGDEARGHGGPSTKTQTHTQTQAPAQACAWPDAHRGPASLVSAVTGGPQVFLTGGLEPEDLFLCLLEAPRGAVRCLSLSRPRGSLAGDRWTVVQQQQISCSAAAPIRTVSQARSSLYFGTDLITLTEDNLMHLYKGFHRFFSWAVPFGSQASILATQKRKKMMIRPPDARAAASESVQDLWHAPAGGGRRYFCESESDVGARASSPFTTRTKQGQPLSPIPGATARGVEGHEAVFDPERNVDNSDMDFCMEDDDEDVDDADDEKEEARERGERGGGKGKGSQGERREEEGEGLEREKGHDEDAKKKEKEKQMKSKKNTLSTLLKQSSKCATPPCLDLSSGKRKALETSIVSLEDVSGDRCSLRLSRDDTRTKVNVSAAAGDDADEVFVRLRISLEPVSELLSQALLALEVVLPAAEAFSIRLLSLCGVEEALGPLAADCAGRKRERIKTTMSDLGSASENDEWLRFEQAIAYVLHVGNAVEQGGRMEESLESVRLQEGSMSGVTQSLLLTPGRDGTSPCEAGSWKTDEAKAERRPKTDKNEGLEEEEVDEVERQQQHERGRGATDQHSDVSWEALLSTEYHWKYCRARVGLSRALSSSHGQTSDECARATTRASILSRPSAPPTQDLSSLSTGEGSPVSSRASSAKSKGSSSSSKDSSVLNLGASATSQGNSLPSKGSSTSSTIPTASTVPRHGRSHGTTVPISCFSPVSRPCPSGQPAATAHTPLLEGLAGAAAHLGRILSALHLCYEDLRLSTLRTNDRRRLAALLCSLARAVHQQSYVDHYLRDCVALEGLAEIPEAEFPVAIGVEAKAVRLGRAQRVGLYHSEQEGAADEELQDTVCVRVAKGRDKSGCLATEETTTTKKKKTSEEREEKEEKEGHEEAEQPLDAVPDIFRHCWRVLRGAGKRRAPLPPSAASGAESAMEVDAGREAEASTMSPSLRFPLFSVPPSLDGPDGPCRVLRAICALYDTLWRRAAEAEAEAETETATEADESVPAPSCSFSSSARDLVEGMVQWGISLRHVDQLRLGIALPLQEAMLQCRRRPPPGLTAAAYRLVGRDDLAMLEVLAENALGPTAEELDVEEKNKEQQKEREKAEKGSPSAPYERSSGAAAEGLGGDSAGPGHGSLLHVRHAATSVSGARRMPISSTGGPGAHLVPWVSSLRRQLPADASASALLSDVDGLGLVDALSTLRFSRDRRMKEVCRLLRSSKPLFLRLPARPESVSAEEEAQAQQQRLLLLCRRSMALSVGRGMLTLSSLEPLLTETLRIPPLCLWGRLFPHQTAVKLDLSGFAPDLAAWPAFHNGVAAGLRVAPGASALSRTWIVYNKPSRPDHAHAGFLMALGLQGHLRALAATDLYDYLSQSHEATSIGLLLGMAAAKRGSMDPAASRMLGVYLPQLLPHGGAAAAAAEVQVSCQVQAAAVAGLGLLYQGSRHRLMTEFLLAEIASKPRGDACEDRDAYVLAAGAALGLVNLGQGRTGGLADLDIENRLYRYLVGGRSDRSGMGDSSAFQSLHSAEGMGKSARINEGDGVNVEVTAPAAALALALTFLKTHNRAVAARLAIPDTLFLLDYVRPDMVLLRTLAKNLVLWRDVEPSDAWLLRQIPRSLWEAFEFLKTGKRTSEQTKEGAQAEEVGEGPEHNDENNAGAGNRGSASGSRSTSTSSGSSRSSHNHQHNDNSSTYGGLPSEKVEPGMYTHSSRGPSFDPDSEDVDWDTVRQSHANVIAGACLAVGLRFAGTRDVAAHCFLYRWCHYFKTLRDAGGSGGAAGGLRRKAAGPESELAPRMQEDADIVSEADHRRAAATAAAGGGGGGGGAEDEEEGGGGRGGAAGGVGGAAGTSLSGVDRGRWSARPRLTAAQRRLHSMSAGLAAKLRPDRSTLEMCLGAAAQSLALVMAGSAELSSLRLLRELRWRVDGEVTYGNHMALNMALGLLCLGGGKLSIGRSDAAVGALLLSLYPRYPLNTGDNMYHLQALRHLYVLAVERRCLHAIDVDTMRPCRVPITLRMAQTQPETHVEGGRNTAGGASGEDEEEVMKKEKTMTTTTKKKEKKDVGDEEEEDKKRTQMMMPNTTKDMTVQKQQQLQEDTINHRYKDEQEEEENEDAHVLHRPGVGGRNSDSANFLSMSTPCLLPELDGIESIEVDGSRYFSYEVFCAGRLPLQTVSDSSRRHLQVAAAVKEHLIVFVKRKMGHLSFEQDPRGLSDLKSRWLSTQLSLGNFRRECADEARSTKHGQKKTSSVAITSASAYPSSTGTDVDASAYTIDRYRAQYYGRTGFLQAFTEDASILAFSHHFCASAVESESPDDCSSKSTSVAGGSRAHSLPAERGRTSRLSTGLDTDTHAFERFCAAVLCECLRKGKPDLIWAYLALYQAVQDLARSQTSSVAVWNLRLVFTRFLAHTDRGLRQKLEGHFLQPEFLASLKSRLEKLLRLAKARSSPSDGAEGGFDHELQQYYDQSHNSTTSSSLSSSPSSFAVTPRCQQRPSERSCEDSRDVTSLFAAYLSYGLFPSPHEPKTDTCRGGAAGASPKVAELPLETRVTMRRIQESMKP